MEGRTHKGKLFPHQMEQGTHEGKLFPHQMEQGFDERKLSLEQRIPIFFSFSAYKIEHHFD